ncbi:SMI1 / KNR4 family (SUKH-1) [Chitinophaga arvensicola]|uniref:SMI1 / KNR4 family (SUKH-1) n=2 Tax=Chitinophaga arvensicola TaxID=29529 RepID=A0A1I0SBV8_9BACT|nr:SMI1 / KNR4 family (SUKH-1) [Chitinophaga arvensicola]
MTAIEKALGITLPGAYRDFLSQASMQEDLPATDLVLLYGTGILLQRNADYEVQRYLPSWISIGDNSGGAAICLHCEPGDPAVYLTGYGALDTGSMEVIGHDFNAWVAGGFSLDVLREAPDVVAFRSSETYKLRKAFMALHQALRTLESARAGGLDLKSYMLQKRILQQQLKDFETQHAGKKYRL